MRYNGPSRYYDPVLLQQDITEMVSLYANINIPNDLNETAALEGIEKDRYESDCMRFDDLLQQLPNTVSISFKDIKSNQLMPFLKKKVC